ncbi:MAG: AAA family ATPase [Planctomycetota bacterium]
MIEQISIRNFKSLAKVDLKLGRLNLFIGTNASGKSNFLDALRVLQGIGYGFTFNEILDGKPKSAASEVWEPIRGGSAMAGFSGTGREKDIVFHVSVRSEPKDKPWNWDYCISFAAPEGQLRVEYLEADTTTIYSSAEVENCRTHPYFTVRYYKGQKGRQPHLDFEKNKPVLGQMARGGNGKWTKSHAESAERVARELVNMQRIDPSPLSLRGYSQAQTIPRMGERGENFAALIKTICADEKAKSAYLSWLKELRPAEVDDVGTLSGAVGEPMFMLKEGGQQYPAPVLSDGTLRFAAITAAFFQPDMPGILTIEEVENGIHASRLRLLVEMLRSRAAAGQTQIIATTHSPIVLAWLKPEEYATTFFCKRDEATGESKICPLTEIPHFMEVVQKQPISDLFAEGWLETAL